LGISAKSPIETSIPSQRKPGARPIYTSGILTRAPRLKRAVLSASKKNVQAETKRPGQGGVMLIEGIET